MSDIRRILYPPSAFNRTVYDFDAAVNRSSTTTLSNDDEERYCVKGEKTFVTNLTDGSHLLDVEQDPLVIIFFSIRNSNVAI